MSQFNFKKKMKNSLIKIEFNLGYLKNFRFQMSVSPISTQQGIDGIPKTENRGFLTHLFSATFILDSLKTYSYRLVGRVTSDSRRIANKFHDVKIFIALYFFGKKAFFQYCSAEDIEFAQKSLKRLVPKEQGEVLITLFKGEATHPLFEKLLLVDHQIPRRYFQALITLSFLVKNDFKHLLIDLWKHRYDSSSPFFLNFWISLEQVERKMVGLEEKIGVLNFIDLDLFEKSEKLWLKNTCQEFIDHNPVDPKQLMQGVEECLTWFCQKEIATRELVLYGLKCSLLFKNDHLFQYIFLNTFQKNGYQQLFTKEFVTKLTLICCDLSRKEIYPLLIKHYPLDDIPDFFNRCYEIVEKNQDKPFLNMLVGKRRLYRHEQQLKARFSHLEGDCSRPKKGW